MFALGLLLATIFVGYGDTPAHAVQRALYGTHGSQFVVERVNVVGRYATVLSRGGVIEASPLDEPILLEHFSFGWQALEFLNYPCMLEVHGISKRDRRSLLLGLSQPKSDRPCPENTARDVGPIADVETLRKRVDGPLVPRVVVAQDFALASWYGAGGGESLFRKDGADWRTIARGGGALGIADMRSFGVPVADWCLFEIYDAKCPAKR